MVTTLEGYTYTCARTDVPRRGKQLVSVNGAPVLIVACETALYALDDRDPQTGGSLAHARVLGSVLTSPHTGAHYNLEDGCYIGGGQWSLPHGRLAMRRVRLVDGHIYVA